MVETMVETILPSFLFEEIKLTDYEKEQLENWEFQGAEYFLHTKRTEEKNTLEKRVCTLGDRFVLSCCVMNIAILITISIHSFLPLFPLTG